jgi:hypothetical protein
MGIEPNLWGYIGPDTILPATSILAAVGGILLAFWNYVAGAAVKAVRFIRRRPAAPDRPATPGPLPACGQD